MRKYCFAILSGMALLALMSVAAWAEVGKAATINGELVDSASCPKIMTQDDPQAAAALCPRASSTAAGYSLISGKRELKLDANGIKMAQAYLAHSESKTAVAVDGTEQADGTMAVTAINAAPTAVAPPAPATPGAP
jgi:hypothetical protein